MRFAASARPTKLIEGEVSTRVSCVTDCAVQTGCPRALESPRRTQLALVRAATTVITGRQPPPHLEDSASRLPIDWRKFRAGFVASLQVLKDGEPDIRGFAVHLSLRLPVRRPTASSSRRRVTLRFLTAGRWCNVSLMPDIATCAGTRQSGVAGPIYHAAGHPKRDADHQSGTSRRVGACLTRAVSGLWPSSSSFRAGWAPGPFRTYRFSGLAMSRKSRRRGSPQLPGRRGDDPRRDSPSRW